MKFSKRRRSDGSSKQGKQFSLSFEQALNVYLDGHAASGHSGRTQMNYDNVLRAFFAYMSDRYGYKAIDEVHEADVLAWVVSLRTEPNKRGRPYSSSSIQTHCRCVIAFFHWMNSHGYLEVNPIERLKEPKADKTLIRVFTEDELKRLDKACDRPDRGRGFTPDEWKAFAARDRAILWLLLSTGIRLSELRGLLFSDIDWDEGMIYVRGKGAKERRIPFGKVARQHLHTYVKYWRGLPSVEGDEHVFLNGVGMPLKSDTMYEIFARLKKVAGITDKRVSPHTCRHWFAVNCIKRGMPTIALKNLLGHESWDMIEVYVHLAEQDNIMLYTQHSPVDALDMHNSGRGRRQQMRDWRNSRKKGK